MDEALFRSKQHDVYKGTETKGPSLCLYSKYSQVHDFESAYEFIERRKIEEAKQIEKHLFGTVESTAFGKQYSSNTDKGTTSTSYSHFNMVGDAEPISKRKKSSGGFFRNLFKK